MQAVILAAGRGTRMRELTQNVPKPLILAGDKTLIEYKLDILPADVSEIILIIGYFGEQIEQRIGNRYNGIPVRYVWQHEPLGTAHALFLAKDLINGKFLVLMGDDIYNHDDLAHMSRLDWGMLVRLSDTAMTGAKVMLRQDGALEDVLEGQEIFPGDLVNAGCYVLGPEIFNYQMVKLAGRSEFGLPQTLAFAAKDRPVNIIKTDRWLSVSSPEDIVQIGDFLRKTN